MSARFPDLAHARVLCRLKDLERRINCALSLETQPASPDTQLNTILCSIPRTALSSNVSKLSQECFEQ